jgi:hypothetical protein
MALLWNRKHNVHHILTKISQDELKKEIFGIKTFPFKGVIA